MSHIKLYVPGLYRMSNNYSYANGQTFPFLGKYDDVRLYSCILLDCYTEVQDAGAYTDTVSVYYSNDKVNALFQQDFTVTGYEQFVLIPVYPYFKINITGHVDAAIKRYYTSFYSTNNIELGDYIANSLLTEIKDSVANTVSTSNSYNALLNAGDTFYGDFENVINYSEINIFIITAAASPGSFLYIYFSTDGINFTGSYAFQTSGDKNYKIPVCAKYFKIIYTNGSVTQNPLAIQTILHSNQTPPNLKISETIFDTTICNIGKSVLVGQTQNLSYKTLSASDQGYLQTQVNGSNSAFGDLLTVNLTQVLQNQFVYGINTELTNSITQGTSSITAANNLALISVGASANTRASMSSNQILKYYPGLGLMVRFTSIFDTAVAGNTQLAGLGDAESGLYFGYSGATFGIVKITAAYREVRTLTINVKSSSIATITIVLDNISYDVPVTNGADGPYTAWEIAQYNFNTVFNGWTSSVNNNVITFISSVSGARSGTYSISLSPGSNIFAQSIAGATGTTTTINQSDWNIDPLNGTGPSGMILNTAYGNVYWIKYQYLGFGQLTFGVENSVDGKLIPVHNIRYVNANSSVSLSNPSMPFNIINTNTTNATAKTIKCASYAAFIEGEPSASPIFKSYLRTITNITTSLTLMFNIRNKIIYNSRQNKSLLYPKTLFISNTDAKNAEITLYENIVLNSTAGFVSAGTTSSAEIDVNSTSFTGGIIRVTVGCAAKSNMQVDLSQYGLIIEPNAILGIYAKSLSTTTDLTISLTWGEDH